jgi:hypothetical protein
VGADTASAVELCELKGGAKFVKGVTAEHDAEEGAVRFEDMVYLGEDGREVIDPM